MRCVEGFLQTAAAVVCWGHALCVVRLSLGCWWCFHGCLELMQEYETAVTLLLDACNKLARLEFERVGALRDMKRAMAARRNALHKIIVHVSLPPWPLLRNTPTSTICTITHTLAFCHS